MGTTGHLCNTQDKTEYRNSFCTRTYLLKFLNYNYRLLFISTYMTLCYTFPKVQIKRQIQRHLQHKQTNHEKTKPYILYKHPTYALKGYELTKQHRVMFMSVIFF